MENQKDIEILNSKKTVETLEDHETRLRNLEKSDIEMRLNISNIDKNVAELKFMINEGNTRLLDTVIKTNESRNETKVYNNKQFWGAVMMILTGILGYFFGAK